MFWVDEEGDRLSASDGVSRYGAYVRDRIAGEFAECWDGTFESGLAERFAALAWRTATGPVMAPPYVCRRPPVLSAGFGLDADGGSDGLIATVEIASPWPRGFDARAGGQRQSWQPWRWEHSFGSGLDYPRGPWGDEVTGGGYFALATLKLVFPVAPGLLPDAPGPRQRRGEVEDIARRAVAVLAAELNRVAGPVIAALERS